MYTAVILEFDGPIATIRLNRPDKLNAIGGAMRDEILHALETARATDTVRVILLTGEGRGFSAGGDISNLHSIRLARAESEFRTILSTGQQITRYIRALPKPVIAAVNGPCAGAGF